MLLIGEILAHAARTAPDAVAATLDDDAIKFGELDAAANRAANGLATLGIGFVSVVTLYNLFKGQR